MKYFTVLLSFSLGFLSCYDGSIPIVNDPPPPKEDDKKEDTTKIFIPDTISQCKHDSFFVKAIVNDRCWVGLYNAIGKRNGNYLFTGQRNEVHPYLEISISAGEEIKLGKKLKLQSRTDFKLELLDEAKIYYFYSSTDFLIATYNTNSKVDTLLNYVVIDAINQDSSIIEGRFEAILPQVMYSVSMYNLPDTIKIKNGSFRLKRK
jgi:hypothetical protein